MRRADILLAILILTSISGVNAQKIATDSLLSLDSIKNSTDNNVSLIQPRNSAFFGDRGTWWLGGSVGWENLSIMGVTNSIRYFGFYPLLRYFVTRHFFVGPRVGWIQEDGEGYSVGAFSIGPELGFAYGNVANSRLVPYVTFGTSYVRSYQTDIEGRDADGYVFPVSLGLMVQLFGNVFFQAEAGYKYEYQSATSADGVLSVSLGLCGLGRRIGISVLSSAGVFAAR